MKRSRELEDELDSDALRADTRPSSTAPLQPAVKLAQLDCAIEDENDQENAVTMRCFLPPHKEPFTFQSYEDYEVHYTKSHTNRCLECRKNFPTEHLLGVHIDECHNPMVLVQREKGEHTYSCFVEGCERKCLTHQKRRMHLIDKHMYPKNFFFGVTKDGIDGRRSLLVEGHHRRRSSTTTQSKESRRRASLLEATTSQTEAGTQTKEPTPKTTPPKKPEKTTAKAPDNDESVDIDMAGLTGAMSSLNFVPPSVRFGRGRAGFSKR
ncbi:hypothetical protein B0J13DRAFT_15557 [Dactylonectria estremocensis]|uniref:C2H2-type domain-containing protein n=1 Tax=Dactylonectria estremocensis TaxID=1079267 RepID=A0A9P9JEJ1_9HYPO|nr:hypothetical protein B0J13DRAFT_15557 [Dactylonectria estremocensis]